MIRYILDQSSLKSIRSLQVAKMFEYLGGIEKDIDKVYEEFTVLNSSTIEYQ